MAVQKYKPLSFSTTMRNPERIASFLKCLKPYENKNLTNDLINQIVRDVIRNKLYKPYYIGKISTYKAIYNDLESVFSDEDLEDIIEHSPQFHKEAGFDAGWPSRFDTWYKLSMEFGFVYYEMGSPIKISKIGHMLIDALSGEIPDDQAIQNVFLNSMMKYQTNNPFRKNLNDNVPLLLLLQVIKKLKEENPDSTGIFRPEISFFICWANNDADELFNFIKEFRNNYKFGTYTDEIIYDKCLQILHAKEKDKKYFKMDKITGEAIDEYIRKMRITGIVSLRGNGRFLDFNTLEMDKINYVIDNYSEYIHYTDKVSYFEFMGKADKKVLTMERTVTKSGEDEIRRKALLGYASTYKKEDVYRELSNVCHKRESKDPMLRIISAPARFEFLTSIALVQNFKEIDVCPNYKIDDEGLPTCTASGGMADIICKEAEEIKALVEVSLMCGRQQVSNEMIPIQRHLSEVKMTFSDAFSIFVAPSIHSDAKKYSEFAEFKDNDVIKTFTINELIDAMIQKERFIELAS